MSLLQAWLLFPALLALVSVGWGLLVERASGFRLPGVLLIPVGLAAELVVARAFMWLDPLAELATPVVALGALAGVALGRERLRTAVLDRSAALAALAVFALYAAPLVLSGSATFAGYTVLGDTAVHLVLMDRIASHGTDLAGLGASSYQTTLEAYFASGYPLGAHAGLAAVRPLAFVDAAWAFQPYLAFIAGALALTLIGLLRPVLGGGWRVAAAAALGSSSAVVFAYAMQGSIKEQATLWLIPLLAALVPLLVAPREAGGGPASGLLVDLRRLLPLAVASAAGVAAIGVAVAAWLGPVLLVALWVVGRRRSGDLRRVAAMAVAFGVGAALLSLPTLADLGDYLDVTQDVVTAQEELGNLLGPLDVLQLFGIWLAGDHRLAPTSDPGIDALAITYGLVGLAAAAAVLGVAWLVRLRAVAPVLFLASSLLALWYVTRTGSPWADAKALAIASPAVLLAAAIGPIALEARGARVEAAVVAGLLAAGVLVSNAMIYHQVSLAPRERLEELADVGERGAGRGPLLYTEFEEFAKHFLHDAQPVGATEGFEVPGLSPRLVDGGRPAFATAADPSALRPEDLDRFRLLVTRRNPEGLRPPADWRLAWSGKYYELWRRGERPEVAGHAKPPPGSCGEVRRLTRRARALGGDLAAAVAPPSARFSPADSSLPSNWRATGDALGLVHTTGPGAVSGSLVVTRTGDYEVWLLGSFGRPVEVRIDGRTIGRVRDELSQPAGWIDMGDQHVEAGVHRAELVRSGGSLAPGNGDGRRMIGPLVLRRAGEAPRITQVPPEQWRSLCARPVAWVEVVLPAA